MKHVPVLGFLVFIATFYRIESVSNDVWFSVGRNGTGGPALCATVDDVTMTSAAKSMGGCAQVCLMEQNCFNFNYRTSADQQVQPICERFANKPHDFSVQANCVFYEKVWSRSSEDDLVKWSPVNIIPGTGGNSGFVSGVTSLDNELFLVRHSHTQIMVHDADDNYTLTRTIDLSFASYFSGLAVLDTNGRIYVSSGDNDVLYSFDAIGNSTGTEANWTICYASWGLSVSSWGNTIVVPCPLLETIRLYSVEGDMVLEIALESGFIPIIAAQLSSDQFGVTDNGNLNRYCIIGLDGVVVRCIGSTVGSVMGQFHTPVDHAHDANGRTYIADFANDRVVMVDPATFTTRLLAIDGGFEQPYCMHYDKSRDRLYVGEGAGQQRVIILVK